MRILAGCLLVLVTTAAPGPVTLAEEAGAAIGGVPQAALDRELLVRFSRAYGMAKSILDEHGVAANGPEEHRALLRDPDRLEPPLRDEIYGIINQNRLDAVEWQSMFVQMEEDAALRERVESLSMPFAY